MVTFPKNFIATKYPGYFWNTENHRLYSIKVSGILHLLASPRKPNRFNHFVEGYQVSVNGHKKLLSLYYLRNIKSANSIIPVEKS